MVDHVPLACALTAVHYLQWVDHIPLARVLNVQINNSQLIDHVPFAFALAAVHCTYTVNWLNYKII